MKTITVSLLILLLSLHGTTYAQLNNVRLKIGPVTAKTKTVAFGDLAPVGYDEAGSYYILTPYSEIMSNAILTTRSYQIAHVNNDMVMDKVVPMNLEQGDKEMTYEFTFELNDKIYVFSSFQNHKLKKTLLFARSLNKKTLQLNEDLRPVAELDYAEEGKYKYASFGYELSRDRSKLLITYNLLDKRSNILSSGFNVLDAGFNILYSQNGSLPGKGIYFYDQFRVSNKGTVYLLARYFTDAKTFQDHAKWKKNNLISNKRTYVTKANYAYQIIRFPKGKRPFKSYTLSIPDQFVTTLDMDINDDHIVCAGFISDPGTTSVNGACFFKIDATSEQVLAQTHKIFGNDFLLEGLSDNEAKKVLKKMHSGENFEDYRYVLKDLHFRQDGGYTLMGEKLMEQLANIREGNMITTEHLYFMKDIVVVNFTPEGEISWYEKIIKNQELAEMGYLYTSFAVSEFKNNLYLLFTNLDKKNANLFGTFKRTEATLVKLNAKGEQEQKVVLREDDDHVTLRAKDTQALNNGVFNIYGQKNENKYGFVKLSLY